MLNEKLLRLKIEDSGITYTAIAKKIGITREGLYKKLSGDSEFKASEIVKISNILNLTVAERNRIFFNS